MIFYFWNFVGKGKIVYSSLIFNECFWDEMSDVCWVFFDINDYEENVWLVGLRYLCMKVIVDSMFIVVDVNIM